MFLQIIIKVFVHDGLDVAPDLRVAELVLGLAFELRIGQLGQDDGRQAFARVLAGQVLFLVLSRPFLRA
jgi:hypothetical protein